MPGDAALVEPFFMGRFSLKWGTTRPFDGLAIIHADVLESILLFNKTCYGSLRGNHTSTIKNRWFDNRQSSGISASWACVIDD